MIYISKKERPLAFLFFYPLPALVKKAIDECLVACNEFQPGICSRAYNAEMFLDSDASVAG